MDEGRRERVENLFTEVLIELIGDYENPDREGLRGTPKRYVKAWEEILSGYKEDPKDLMKDFEEKHYEEMIYTNFEFFSICEHHLLPFFGTAHVAYIPSTQRVIGLSKLGRLVDMYSNRLQIQERICEQVTNALMVYLKPHAAACIIEAEHFCMKIRGVKKFTSTVITSSLKGKFRTSDAARSELMSFVGNKK